MTTHSIVTQTYLARQVGQVRGILRAITRPTSINQLSNKFNIEEVRMKAIIEDLTKSEQVSGKTAKGLFIPASFIGMQTRTVKQFFDEHSYVDKALFDKLQIDLPLSKYFEKHPLP